MRVALVCGYDWAIPGGVRNQVSAIARFLAARGDEVAVLAPAPTGGAGTSRAPTVPSPEPYRLYVVGRSYGLPANGSVAPVAPTPAACWRTRRSLRHFAPDVVHVHEPLVPGPPLAAVFTAPVPVVATFHRADTDVWYRLEGRLVGPAVSARIAVATGVSQAAIATARTAVGGRLGPLVEVGNGVDVERFERAREAAAGRPGAGPYKNGRRPVICFVGRHEPRKGARVLVEAVRMLDRDLEAVIAGEGPETEALERQAAGDPRVRFAGRIGDEEAARLVAGADVFAAPATGGESFGVVLLEAMAAGTAVVASDVPGYRLAAAGAAVHVPAGDARALAGAIEGLLDDGARRAALAERGLARARECAIDVVTSAYAECYREALRSGN